MPRCLLAEEEDATPAAPPGLVLDKLIGRGGMGRVFRARHVRLDRPVAVKFLPAELASDPAFEARFAREARALGLLAHPHVVGVHDFGTTDAGESYLVMEWMPGGTLAERLPLDARGRAFAWRFRSATGSPTPTPRGWCTGTSSPRTSCSTRPAGPRSPTSASRA